MGKSPMGKPLIYPFDKNGGSFAKSPFSHGKTHGFPMVFRTSKASKQAMELAEFLSQVVQAPTGDGEK